MLNSNKILLNTSDQKNVGDEKQLSTVIQESQEEQTARRIFFFVGVVGILHCIFFAGPLVNYQLTRKKQLQIPSPRQGILLQRPEHFFKDLESSGFS